jgi:hypothetical protein
MQRDNLRVFKGHYRFLSLAELNIPLLPYEIRIALFKVIMYSYIVYYLLPFLFLAKMARFLYPRVVAINLFLHCK